MIDVGCLKTIQIQWQALAGAFKRLADTLPFDDLRRASVGNPHGDACGFEWWALNQAHRLQTEYLWMKHSSAAEIQVRMPLVLKASQQSRQDIGAQFTELFGLQQKTDNLDELFCRTLLNDLDLFIGDYLREVTTLKAER